VVWRWQERFMHEGVDGLTRDKTRPSRIPPLPAATVDRVIALTNQAPPHAATHWTAPAMAKAVGISPSSVRRMWKGHGLQPHRVRAFKISNDPKFADKCRGGRSAATSPLLLVKACLAAIVLLWCGTGVAQELVHFPSLEDNGPGKPSTTLDGYMFRSPGAGTHPALVFLHGCDGLFNRATGLIGRRRTRLGG
jgi:hypothetical protein